MSSIRFARPALLLGAALSCNAVAQGYPDKADYEKWGKVIAKANIKE